MRIELGLLATGSVLVLACEGVRPEQTTDFGPSGPDSTSGDEASTGSTTGTGNDSGAPQNTGDGTTHGTTGAASETGPGEAETGSKFDLGGIPDVGDPVDCEPPEAVHCDELDDDPWHAMGLNCPGGPSVQGTVDGHDDAFEVFEGNLGVFQPPPFPPREGTKFVMMSTGAAYMMRIPNATISTELPGHDPGALPAPLVPSDVGETDCIESPLLVGTGDCSNTIEGQWDQQGEFGGGAYDYAEMRAQSVVPERTTGFEYDFAMFSEEYPTYYGSEYNDMYIAWLESERWTGNVSFDEMGNPISLNASFLDYKDYPNPMDCPAPCEAPELSGTAMAGHAGTKWLTTTAPVTPGETITVVFAVFDLTDQIHDMVILLDRWAWNCEGGPPVTAEG